MQGFDDLGLTIRQASTADDALPGSLSTLALLVRVDGEPPDPDRLIKAVNECRPSLQLHWTVYETLRDLVSEAGRASPRSARCNEWAARLLLGLSIPVLSAAFDSQSIIADRRRFLNAVVDVVPPGAILRTVAAAAKAYEKQISPPLAALLTKLRTGAAKGSDGNRQRSAAALRSLAHEILESWSYGVFDTSPTGIEHFFDEQRDRSVSSNPETERLVQIALETGAVGPALWDAVQTMALKDQARELVGMLKLAPDNRATAMIASQFANPQRLGALLREQEVDFASIDVLIAQMGTTATEPLLEELTTSNSRVVRRGILDRLAKLGPGISAAVTDRLLEEERWFVVRNMLHVLREAGCPVENVALPTFQNHSDARVRREAMLLLFRDPVARERAVTTGLKDSDPYIIRSALKEARNGLPDSAVPVLAKRVFEQDFPPEFRLAAIQLLGRSKSVLALEPLLRFVQGGTTLLGKPKLAPKSPEMIAALRALARTWPHERRAKPLLEVAAASADPQITATLDVAIPDVRDPADDGTE